MALVDGVEAEVRALSVDPESDGDAVVVEPRHLGLGRTREVLVYVVALTVVGKELVALVRVPVLARPEIAGDLAVVVDPEQLIERVVLVVVERVECVVAAAVGGRGKRNR
jgi:hypothetical protein